MKAWFLKLHRWIALVFALPLGVVLVTGLVLSFEPMLVVQSMKPAGLDADRIEALLKQHDPNARARAVSYRSYDGTLTIGARGAGTVVDVATGAAQPAPSGTARFLLTARRLHETLLLDAGWLVIASTAVMLALALLGVLMGLPRFENTLSGWHMVFSWGVLPLVVLSPLTALLMAGGITLADPPPRADASAAPADLATAVRLVGTTHDLSGLVWIRPQGNRVLARIVEGGEYRVYAVTSDAVTPAPRNWPRLWHEGNFAGSGSAWLNVVASIAMIGLAVTGPWLWLRRTLRRRRHRLRTASVAR